LPKIKEQENQTKINEDLVKAKDTNNLVANQDKLTLSGSKLTSENTRSKASDDTLHKLKEKDDQAEHDETEDIDLNEDDDELPDIG
jgi:hypothetical protein